MILLLTLPLWWFGETIIGIASIFPILELVSFFIAIWLLREIKKDLLQTSNQAQDFSLNNIIDLLKKQGVYAILSLPIKTVSDQMPIWFLRLILGETTVGIFAAARLAYTYILAVFRTIETTLFPLVAEQMTLAIEQLQVALRQAQKYTFWGGLIVILISTILAEFMLSIIAGDTYLQAVPIFRLLIWHLLFFALSQSQRPVFFAAKAQKWLFITYGLGAIVGLISYPITISQFGVMGAAISFLIYNGTVIAARQYVTRNHIPQFYISVRTIFKIESFDILLYETITNKIFRK